MNKDHYKYKNCNQEQLYSKGIKISIDLWTNQKKSDFSY